MLDLFEKITHGFCFLIILTVIFLYVIVTLPDNRPLESIEGVETIEVPTASATSSSRMTESTRALVDKVRKEVDETDLRKKLREQGLNIGPTPIKQEIKKIPTSTFEVIQAPTNWTKQLNLVGSLPVRGKGNEKTRLKITKIAPSSLMSKLGFEANDVIELIDGQIIEFNDHSTMEYRAMFKKAIDRVRQGEQISITVTRNRQPVNLVFSL